MTSTFTAMQFFATISVKSANSTVATEGNQVSSYPHDANILAKFFYAESLLTDHKPEEREFDLVRYSQNSILRDAEML